MRRLPPLGALRAFEAAARHKNFARAAVELGVTPTAISHQVRSLEQACGQALFRRRPRPLALTTAGARLLPVLSDGFDAFADAIAALRPPRATPPLRVTMPNAFAGHWLVPRLPGWRAAHPAVPLEVIGTNAVLDLQAGEADVAIRYARTPPADGIAREILRDAYRPVCSPALLPGREPVMRAAELLRFPLIHFDWTRADPDAPNWRRWLVHARAAEPELRGHEAVCHLSFREELHAIDAAIAGEGVAICSDVVVGGHLRSGALVQAHALTLPGYRFFVAWHADHARGPLIEAFAAWLRAAA
ncbi:MAG: LysR family transcriptional regulator [Alphaproteobacteria bacterium]|nr:LysR family transcriptional regulator [Alphaproteobacteria bacterium]